MQPGNHTPGADAHQHCQHQRHHRPPHSLRHVTSAPHHAHASQLLYKRARAIIFPFSPVTCHSRALMHSAVVALVAAVFALLVLEASAGYGCGSMPKEDVLTEGILFRRDFYKILGVPRGALLQMRACDHSLGMLYACEMSPLKQRNSMDHLKQESVSKTC